ncbi:MAG TPA: PAS domain-containing sensor histidine kinase [Nannocystaceae bacterium]|nr:PAS domain-containing sensor histidine kinase [Nannocystaceae bacterium]
MSSGLSATEYRLLVENSPVMIWRAGLDAKCDYFNETWLAFTGRTLAQEQGDGWAEGVHSEDFERCVHHYLEHFEKREAFEMEYRLRRHDGVYRWIFDRGVPYYDEDGVFLGFIGSCVDVEERRSAERLREQNNRQELAFAQEFERWMLAIVSHDLRNPLGAIDGSAQVLAMRAGGDEQLARIADRISRSAARITNMVADLLDLARERHGGGIPVRLEHTDVCSLCREVALEIGTFATDREIVVACDGDPNGLWDPNRLTQALSNLIGNAVKHGAAGAPVDVRVSASDAHVVVAVHNDGTIPSETMTRLFEPFAARSYAPRQSGGLGLGLFIAKAIAHAHRGDIQVHSSPELGTTFRLVLPRAA